MFTNLRHRRRLDHLTKDAPHPTCGHAETIGYVRKYGSQTFACPRFRRPVPATALRVTLFLLAYVLILLVASLPKGLAPQPLADVVWGGVASVALLVLTRWVLTREGRAWRDVGLDVDGGTLPRLVAGVAIGAAVYGVTLGLLSLTLGPLSISSAAWPSATIWLRVTASFLALACMEELGFRAYALRTLVGAVGSWPAQLAIAVAFGLSHRLFGRAWLTILLGVIPSALRFGVVAVRSGGLAMPIGVHAALNVAQWMVGAKESPGIWTLDMDPSHVARMATFAPYVSLTVTVLAALMIAGWPARRRAAAGGSAAAIVTARNVSLSPQVVAAAELGR